MWSFLHFPLSAIFYLPPRGLLIWWVVGHRVNVTVTGSQGTQTVAQTSLCASVRLFSHDGA